MSVSLKFEEWLQSLPAGKIFSYDDLKLLGGFNALSLALSRSTKKGHTKRLSKGLYFKSYKDSSKYPPKEEIFRHYSRYGAITGQTAVAKLNGKVSELPNFEFVGNRSSSIYQIAGFTIKFIKTAEKVSERDSKVLAILNILRNYKKLRITNELLLQSVMHQISLLNAYERSRLVANGLNYKSSVRALVGAILDHLHYRDEAGSFRRSLNSLTSYKIDIDESSLPNLKEWKIS